MIAAPVTFAVRRDGRRGVTIVELLVVVAIIGVLLAILLPTVQSAREAARRTACLTNLRQIAAGCLAHESARGFLPTGGWGGFWAGDPDRGFDEKQPGGWAFNILPHLEEKDLRNLGVGMTDAAAKADLAVVRLTKPMPIFVCPSRGAPSIRSLSSSLRVIAVPTTVTRSPSSVVRGDYAACMGSGALPRNNYLSGGTPSTVAVGDLMTEVQWRTSFGPPPDGVIFRRSRIRLREISDGLSATYLLGERYANPNDIMAGRSADEDDNLYAGHSRDMLRVGLEPPSQDRAGFDPVTVSGIAGTSNKYPLPIPFGSAHGYSCGMAMADGSVRSVAYSIDAAVHRYAASRNDGQAIR